ncbi:hypothetical protein dsat_1618 [Alkalidesulfovibrio alkalitolerans DSM 16529]|uniref:Uncharacterized protein n=1 Tax=Alkalidesulfovibrio alkalitolerans DSM 16529 TaxID=1121439 RepID=S7UE24_9BACT|nr:hypothetical protein [Alkalidesulfovibrio alkalitolerans]EPR30478.1 hypothetical protein dsat_1618 [Alkalidesulfovibrio alkalitolerans DSM 16529]
MSAAEKISTLNDYRHEPENQPAEAPEKTSRDMGKVALFVSILAVLLLVVFFFGLNQNLKGLTAEVQVMSGDVAALKTTVADMPEQVRKSIVADELFEITSKLGYMRGKVSEEQAARLTEALTILQGIQGQVQE